MLVLTSYYLGHDKRKMRSYVSAAFSFLMRQKAFLQVSGYAGVEAPVIAPENIDTP